MDKHTWKDIQRRKNGKTHHERNTIGDIHREIYKKRRTKNGQTERNIQKFIQEKIQRVSYIRRIKWKKLHGKIYTGKYTEENI